MHINTYKYVHNHVRTFTLQPNNVYPIYDTLIKVSIMSPT